MTDTERIDRLERNFAELYKFMEGICQQCDDIGGKLQRLDVDKLVKALSRAKPKL